MLRDVSHHQDVARHHKGQSLTIASGDMKPILNFFVSSYPFQRGAGDSCTENPKKKKKR
ncbi:hypothetical protein Syun_018447 [Stephania yunnanensis]|uniref:Uncharacterized protein n=1 Tax=Stephania yunnanensis TaxID=152371 RepID=A0AAP0ISX6_9MAGN